MRILHVYKAFYPDSLGGIERVIQDLCSDSSDELTQDVFTLSSNPHPVIYDSHGVKVYRGKMHARPWSTPISLTAHQLFKKILPDYDLLHYHFPWPYADLLDLTYGQNHPSVITYHMDIVRQAAIFPIYQSLMHRFLNRAKVIVATSQPYVDTSQVLNSYLSKTQVVPLAVELPQSNASSKEKIAAWEKIVGRDFFLFIGAFRHYKGLDILLRALAKTHLPLVVLGDGPDKEYLKNQASALGLKEPQLIWLGALPDDDKWAILELSKALVLPSISRAEAFGVVLLEAAMRGKPLITTDLPNGSRLINQNEETGLVVPVGDSLTLSQAMQRLHHDDQLCRRLGQAAQELARESFTVDRQRQSYRQIYADVLSPSKRGNEAL